jgi:hypothetical protein
MSIHPAAVRRKPDGGIVLRVLIPFEWSVVSGPLSVASGQWLVVSGQWFLVRGRVSVAKSSALPALGLSVEDGTLA